MGAIKQCRGQEELCRREALFVYEAKEWSDDIAGDGDGPGGRGNDQDLDSGAIPFS
jgi:hypothetical protein